MAQGRWLIEAAWNELNEMWTWVRTKHLCFFTASRYQSSEILDYSHCYEIVSRQWCGASTCLQVRGWLTLDLLLHILLPDIPVWIVPGSKWTVPLESVLCNIQHQFFQVAGQRVTQRHSLWVDGFSKVLQGVARSLTAFLLCHLKGSQGVDVAWLLLSHWLISFGNFPVDGALCIFWSCIFW